MAKSPYADMPDYAYWRRSVAGVAGADIDPVVDVPFRFGAKAKVATAGSCFAQHIGRYLKAADCAYLVTEKPHPVMTEEAARVTNYGVFTARYGNVYTARQLVQLLDRAYGRFKPTEDIWDERDGVLLDPFRPTIQPRGFNSLREYEIGREQHFRAVREAFETLDVFVFTLGLTEAWRSRADGAVFPLCPGVSGGVFSPDRHKFVNFGVDEVVADLKRFIEGLRGINPAAKIILTVSPVPLAATAEKRHVLTSTVYSKSVLRVAAEMTTRAFADVAYFPSYEIVASGVAGDYFAADKRSVTEEGVAHVMRIFANHFLKGADAGKGAFGLLVHRAMANALGDGTVGEKARTAGLQAAFQVMCDEEALDANPALFASDPERSRPT